GGWPQQSCRGFSAGLQVDYLRVCRGIAVPEVFGDDIAHAGDFGELVAYFLNPEVEVLRTNEQDVIRLAFPDRAQEAGDEFDQAARLLELLIFFEQGNNVFQARTERIGSGDFVCNGFGTATGDLGLTGFLQLPAIARGDVADRGLVGQGRKQ